MSYCHGKRVDKTNSLEENFPDVAQLWHPKKWATFTFRHHWFTNFGEKSIQSDVHRGP